MDFTRYLELRNNCDPDDKLLSETDLGEYLGRMHLSYNCNDLIKFCLALDVEQLISTESGLSRDYRGLGELMQFSFIEIEAHFKRSQKPTKSLIEAFVNKNLNQGRQVTIKDLLKMLERLERFDVIDDLIPVLISSAQRHLSGAHEHPTNPRYQQVLPHGTDFYKNNNNININSTNDCPIVNDGFERLTIDDISSRQSPLYDAFICFAPEDFGYAQELISLLEDGGIRVATADHLLPGHFEHDSLAKLIDERCRKVLTILTPNFPRSKECEFQTKFASEMAIKSGDIAPKIIPVVFEPCDESQLPHMIRVTSKIHLTNRENQKYYEWQKRKLFSALEYQAPNSHPMVEYSTDRRALPQIIKQQQQQLAITNNNPSTSHERNTESPIVDLASSTMNSRDLSSLAADTQQHQLTNSNQMLAERSPPAINNSGLSGPISGWFKKVKGKVLGTQSSAMTPSGLNLIGTPSPTQSLDSLSPSNSSQAVLITRESAEDLGRG